MNRILTLAVVFLCLAVSARAQQRLDIRSLPTPSKTIVHTHVSGLRVLPGLAGIGINWDFSNLPSGIVSQHRYLSLAELPSSVRDSFPLAQVAVRIDTVTTLYATVGNYFRLLGYVTPNTQLTVTTDPYDTRPTEIVHTGRLLDSYKGVIRVGGVNGQIVRRSGVHSLEYDGFGTLVLPRESYSDVARISRIGSTLDSLVTPTVTIVVRTNTRRTTYQKFNSDTILLEIVETTTSTTRNGQPVGTPLTIHGITYVGDNSVTDVHEATLTPLSLYPNPTNGNTLTVVGIGGLIESISAFDPAGSAVSGLVLMPKSEVEASILLPQLSVGQYVLVCTLTDGSVRILTFQISR